MRGKVALVSCVPQEEAVSARLVLLLLLLLVRLVQGVWLLVLVFRCPCWAADLAVIVLLLVLQAQSLVVGGGLVLLLVRRVRVLEDLLLLLLLLLLLRNVRQGGFAQSVRERTLRRGMQLGVRVVLLVLLGKIT